MEYRTVHLYYPKGVVKVIGFGSSSFIGLLNETKVLKYPRIKEEQWDRFVIEQKIYDALGSHPRIITCYGLDERGITLEYACKGTVRDLLNDSNRVSSFTDRDRIRLCWQAAEGIAYLHTKNVVHCNICTQNFLLDKNSDVKLCDFQGIYIDPKGVVWNGYALESAKSYLPHPSDHSDKNSDLFALGSAIYEIIVGHEPFPELNEPDDEDEIEKRYRNNHFPSVDGVLGGSSIYKCWSLAYDQVHACVEELKALENCLIS